MLGDKKEVWQGAPALVVLKTLEAVAPLHGYGIARRIEQTGGGPLPINYGTLYPVLVKPEQEGYVSAERGVSDDSRRAMTRAGRRQFAGESPEWEQTAATLARSFAPAEES